MFSVLGSSAQVLKAAVFKRFSVCSCWSPIFLKFQNSIAGVFQCIFKKISEHVFYGTTMNWFFGTKKGRCKYWSSIVLFESGIISEKTKVQILKFLLQVSFRYHFRGVRFKERFWPRKSKKKKKKKFLLEKKERKLFYGETKRCSKKMLIGRVVPRKITEEFTFVNRTAV